MLVISGTKQTIRTAMYHLCSMYKPCQSNGNVKLKKKVISKQMTNRNSKFPFTDQKYPQLFSGTWRHPWHMRDYSVQQASRTLDTHWRCLFLFLASGKMSCSDRVWRRQSRVPRYPGPATWRWLSVWMANGAARHTDRAWPQRRSRCAFLFPFRPRSGKCERTFCSHSDWCRNKGYRKRLAGLSLRHFVCEHNQESSTTAGHRSLRTLAVLHTPPMVMLN